MDLTNLSDDCLMNIFQFFDRSTDRESFGLTCHRLLRIQNLCRRNLHFSCSLMHLSPESLSRPLFRPEQTHLTRVLNRFLHLESLSLSGCVTLTDSCLSDLQNHHDNLRSLNFDCCSKITDRGFSLAFKSCSSLTTVSLYRCHISDLGLTGLAESCPGLTHLNLSHCSNISDEGLSAVSKLCRQIRVVRVSSSNGISGAGFAGSPPTLAHLEAASCSHLDPEGVEAAASGGGLEYLDVSSASWRISGDCLVSFGASGLGSRLGILNLRLCRDIGDGSVSAIAKGCPLLWEVNLALCHGVKLPGWESIGAFCGNLARLHVNGCRGLCDRGLLALQYGCQRLEVLYMTRIFNVSPAAIEMFKCSRIHVRVENEEVMCIGPKIPFR